MGDACFSRTACLFKNQVSIGRVVGIFPDVWLGWGCLWSVECSGQGGGLVVCGVDWVDGVDQGFFGLGDGDG